MCDKSELVPIPDFLFEQGGVYEFDASHPEYGIDNKGRKCFVMDACIVPSIKALWAVGVVTIGCCCGHGKGEGVVSLKTEKYETVLPQEVLDKYCGHNWAKWECPTCNAERPDGAVGDSDALC